MFKKSICCMILLIAMLISSCAQNEMHYPETETPSPSNFTIEIPSYIESEDQPLPNYTLIAEQYQYYEGYLYFFNGHPSNSYTLPATSAPTTLLRMNLRTGNITTLCPDPLCDHNSSDCPFAGNITSFFIDDQTVFYRRSYNEYDSQSKKHDRKRQLCIYDMKNMKLTVLKEEEIISQRSYGETKQCLYDSINKQYYYNDYVYDEKNDDYSWATYRMDITTGKETVFMKNSSSDITERFLFLLDDRIYFTDTFQIYSTDLNLQDKQIHAEGNFISKHIFTNGKHIFYDIPQDDETVNLYRLDLNGKNPIDLHINTTTGWQLTQNYIYYPVPAHKLETGVNLLSNAINRCDHNGENHTQIVKTEFGENGSYQQLTGCKVIGNYIYCNFYVFTDTNDNNIYDNTSEYSSNFSLPDDFHFLRIDTTTGEMIKLYIPDV